MALGCPSSPYTLKQSDYWSKGVALPLVNFLVHPTYHGTFWPFKLFSKALASSKHPVTAPLIEGILLHWREEQLHAFRIWLEWYWDKPFCKHVNNVKRRRWCAGYLQISEAFCMQEVLQRPSGHPSKINYWVDFNNCQCKIYNFIDTGQICPCKVLYPHVFGLLNHQSDANRKIIGLIFGLFGGCWARKEEESCLGFFYQIHLPQSWKVSWNKQDLWNIWLY